METFWEIVNGDVRALKLMSIPLYLLAALGFFIQIFTQEVDDLTFVLSLLNVWFWFGLFFLISTGRFIGLFFRTQPSISNVLISGVGLWAWAVIFASSFVDPQRGSMAVLYLIPIIVEFWFVVTGFKNIRGQEWTF